MSEDELLNKEETVIISPKISWHVFILLCALIISIIIGTNIREQHHKSECNSTDSIKTAPIYWVYSQKSNVEDRNGILKHVHLVLNRIGFIAGTNESDWDLLWSHDFPFRLLYSQIRSLKRHQRVNHFPGTGYITNKVDFATSNSKFIPKAFKIPTDYEKFKEYAVKKPDALFVQKHNQHRKVTIKNVTEIDLGIQEYFIQEYVRKPFLVDGHKFDIGVYTILTSVDPLRVYIYKGDVLFRYCPEKYYPFDPLNLDKYVIGDDYMPTWEVPSLSALYSAFGYGMKDTFDAYVKSKGKNPAKIWAQVDEFIGDFFVQKESYIISALKNYRGGHNFFELMRFDFVIDEDLNLYALEANMSPNLSSAHFPPNQLLYEQVIYSTFSLVGVARYIYSHSLANRNPAETQMCVSDKNIMTSADICGTEECHHSCENLCKLCKHCLSLKMREAFIQTVNEQLNRNDCRRVYPPIMEQGNSVEEYKLKKLSPSNLLMHMWIQSKCNHDITWCS